MALLFAFGYFPPEWPMSRSVNAALISTVAASIGAARSGAPLTGAIFRWPADLATSRLRYRVGHNLEGKAARESGLA
jgi:hypothetical protein